MCVYFYFFSLFFALRFFVALLFVQDFDPQALQDDIRKLKLIVKAHERRIKSLEEKLAQLEANTSEEDDCEQAQIKTKKTKMYL